MFSMTIYLHGLLIAAVAAVCTWVLSVFRRNVGIVDSLWALLFLIAALAYAWGAETVGPRAVWVLCLVTAWLSLIHI